MVNTCQRTGKESTPLAARKKRGDALCFSYARLLPKVCERKIWACRNLDFARSMRAIEIQCFNLIPERCIPPRHQHSGGSSAGDNQGLASSRRADMLPGRLLLDPDYEANRAQPFSKDGRDDVCQFSCSTKSYKNHVKIVPYRARTTKRYVLWGFI